MLDVNDLKYYFYKDGITWAEAMSTCNVGDMHLINVGNLDLARFLLDGMTGMFGYYIKPSIKLF